MAARRLCRMDARIHRLSKPTWIVGLLKAVMVVDSAVEYLLDIYGEGIPVVTTDRDLACFRGYAQSMRLRACHRVL